MGEMTQADDQSPDFAAAESFLKASREAHEAGDLAKFSAARTMLAVSLGIVEATPESLTTARFKR